MTIEERAKAFANERWPKEKFKTNDRYRRDHYQKSRDTYIAIATEQKEIDDALMGEERQKAFKAGYDTAIKEACKWVDDNVGTMTAIAIRKAME